MTVQLPAGMDEELETSVETIRNANEGDEVLWGDRSEPLTITDTGGEPGEDRYIVAQGPRGGMYTIREQYSDGGIPEFHTDEGQPIEQLRPANFSPEDRIPQFTSFGGTQQSDATPGVQTEETGESGPEGFEDLDIIESDNEMVVEGFHIETNTQFEAVYNWESEVEETPYGGDIGNYRLQQGQSDFGDLTLASQSMIVGDLEDYLTDQGFSINRTTPSAEERFDPQPPEDVEGEDADNYVADKSQGQSDFTDMVEESDSPLSDQPPESIVDRVTEDMEPGWTFADEVLQIAGREVKRQVNNWELIDYGVVTDDTIDVSRKLAWYNVESDSLVMLGGVKSDGDTHWFVYHAPDTNDISDEERDPEFDTDDFDEALDYAYEILYDGEEEVDFSVKENPVTGKTTIYDAVSNTHLARAIVSLKSADPAGLRSYAKEANVPQFILDLDSALYRLFKRVQGGSENMAETWGRFAEGAGLPTRERTRAFFRNLDPNNIGQETKNHFLNAMSGLKRRYSGAKAYPVIRYDELGVLLEYSYTPEGSDGGGLLDLTIDPRITEEVTDENDNVIRTKVHGFVVDSMLPRGLSYYQLVDIAEWMDVNEYVFNIPDPWSDEQSKFSAGKKGKRSPSSGGQTASDYDDVRDLSGISDAVPPLLKFDSIEPDGVEDYLEELSDQNRQHYVLYAGMFQEAIEEIDEDEFEGWDGPETTNFREQIGQIRADFKEGAKSVDLRYKDDFLFEVFYDALGDFWGSESDVDALDSAIENWHEDVATSEDFRDEDMPFLFTRQDQRMLADADKLEQARQRQAQQGESGEGDDGDPIGSGPDNPPGEPDPPESNIEIPQLSDDEVARVNMLMEQYASGKPIDEFGVEDRNLLSQAHELAGILPPGGANELEQLRSSRSDFQGEEKTVGADDADAMMDNLAEAKEMNDQERHEAAREFMEGEAGYEGRDELR